MTHDYKRNDTATLVCGAERGRRHRNQHVR
jgi:hypothetical protein